jgi:hypothetical protein
MDFFNDGWMFAVDSYLKLSFGMKPRLLGSLGTFAQYILNGWLYYYKYQEQWKLTTNNFTGLDSILNTVTSIPLGLKELDYVLRTMANHGQDYMANYTKTGIFDTLFFLVNGKA